MLEIIKPTTPVLIQDLGMFYLNNNSKESKRYGLYKCQCGSEFRARSSDVKSGNTKSCGCFHSLRVKQSLTTHGMRDGLFYSVWSSMVQRCINIKSQAYCYYGGIGISVCDRWLKFENFRDDMYPRYQEGLTIDRINNDGNYEPSNCRWATRVIQSRNTRLLRSDNTSGYRGISWNKARQRWTTQICINSKLKYLGMFNTAIDAAKAYDNYVIENNLEHTINGVI